MRDSEDALESNVDFAQVQARQQGVSAAAQKAFPLPLLGFVSTLNGLGGGITLGVGSVPAGITVSFSTGTGTISFNLSGTGTMALKNAIAAVADLSQTISNPPTQAEVQAISDKIDELLAAARTAGHLTP